jgi:hypothetical protein
MLHVENIYTLLAVVVTGGYNILAMWLKTRKDNKAHEDTESRLSTIKILVNGRLSESLLRIEQLSHELNKNDIAIPPPATPVVRTIVVQPEPTEGTPDAGHP